MKHRAVRAWRVLGLLLSPLAGCGERDGSLGLVDLGGPAQDPAPTGEAPEGPRAGIADERTLDMVLQREPLAAGARSVLQTYCSSCHGADRVGDVLGEPTDIAGQIARGNIVPGSAAQSPLLQRIADGSMPPGRLGPTPGERALLERFIEQLPAPDSSECPELPFLSTDALYAALLQDLRSVPSEDRAFFRYTGLSYASNAGWCGAALERQRAALFKLVNSVSTAPDIVLPQAVDERGLLYRLDLRAYGWNRAIVPPLEGSASFTDGWAAIVAGAGVYALELQGAEADELKRETGALVPYLPANALLHAAAGEAYYPLLGMADTLKSTAAALGIELYDDAPFPPPLQRAGFPGGRVDAQVLRIEQQGGSVWTMQTIKNDGASNIFDRDPLSLVYGGESFFHLQNGLLAYQLEGGYQLAQSHLGCSTCLHSPTPEVASCHACHQTGVLPVTDWIRSFVQDNPVLFPADTVPRVAQLYPLPAELDALLLSDTQLHTAASERAGASLSAPDPLSYVYYQFEHDSLPLARAAGELGVTPEALLAGLPHIETRLRWLQEPGGSVPRRILDESYAQASCILYAESRNRPVSCP